MKKAIFIASIVFMAAQANAETYKTSFVAPNNSGQPYNTGMVVDLNFADDGAISGEMKILYNAPNCKWRGEKITGGNFKDGMFRWATDLNPTKGCGRIVFIGKKEGDKLVGYLPSFQGVKIDIEFQKD